MSPNLGFLGRRPKPVCVGTGLVALDIVINGKPDTNARFAGGSCGNVLTILAYLGWDAYPIARLRNDAAASALLEDLKRWDVDTRLISRDASGSTPIIVERIGTSHSGAPQHRYEWTCPTCGARLPRYRPVLARSTKEISENMPTAQVFYFDRVARSSVVLAQEQRCRGALVVFEPSHIRNERLFRECLEVTDVLKYASDRVPRREVVTDGHDVSLEIETLGAEGLRYKLHGEGSWTHLPAYEIGPVRDTAGAGDWCTAGIIQLLGTSGQEGFHGAARDQLEEALRFGQALASVNCCYEGPRGSMYDLSTGSMQTLVCEIMANSISDILPKLSQYNSFEMSEWCICFNQQSIEA